MKLYAYLHAPYVSLITHTGNFPIMYVIHFLLKALSHCVLLRRRPRQFILRIGPSWHPGLPDTSCGTEYPKVDIHPQHVYILIHSIHRCCIVSSLIDYLTAPGILWGEKNSCITHCFTSGVRSTVPTAHLYYIPGGTYSTAPERLTWLEDHNLSI